MYDVIYLQLVQQIEKATGIRIADDIPWLELIPLHARTCNW